MRSSEEVREELKLTENKIMKAKECSLIIAFLREKRRALLWVLNNE